MPIKISKAVKDLNIGMQTARDFLKKNEIEVDDNINARISDEAYNLLIQKFKPAMQQKKAAEQIIHVKLKKAKQWKWLYRNQKCWVKSNSTLRATL